ncbi:hypothetical protein IT779_23730 [Nocardia sp. NEAU-351]|uniref:Secreted protein n=2 Tax=Nocardia bovistercoris TaxID=2785916 RepID=A0A931N4X4_9NOCA|nr:hypothetical protein [Nocardia bovistercoris]MBH0779284.1 hypothetical protein [Nocardia bovistercoris]
MRVAMMVPALAAAVVLGTGAVASAAPSSGSSGSSGGSGDTGSGSGSADGGGSFGPLTQLCNQSTKSGGAGVTSTVHQIGRSGPTSFVLSYETYAIPDLIEVFYEGSLVRSTGYVGDNINQGTGSVVVNLPAGAATSVTVRVTGPNSTDWDYTVHCPS